MRLNEIRMPSGRYPKKIKRLGRGKYSCHGGTSTRGHKGQRARSGGFGKPQFEGGQMPLIRRLPKKGFKSINRKEYEVVNVGQLALFPPNTVVDAAKLIELGLVKKSSLRIKLLAKGDIPHAVHVKLTASSAAAKAKIEKAGGRMEIVE